MRAHKYVKREKVNGQWRYFYKYYKNERPSGEHGATFTGRNVGDAALQRAYQEHKNRKLITKTNGTQGGARIRGVSRDPKNDISATRNFIATTANKVYANRNRRAVRNSKKAAAFLGKYTHVSIRSIE